MEAESEYASAMKATAESKDPRILGRLADAVSNLFQARHAKEISAIPQFTPDKIPEPFDLSPRVITTRLEPAGIGTRTPQYEAVRDPVVRPTDPDRKYLENYGRLLDFITSSIHQGVHSADQWYTEYLPQLHRIMTSREYRGVSPGVADRVEPGKYRLARDISTSPDLIDTSEILCFADSTKDKKQGSWPIHISAESQLDDFENAGVNAYGGFVYPMPESIQPALEQVRQFIQQALESEQEPDILQNLAKAFWHVRFHPFEAVNNSIFMGLVNGVLEVKHMKKMPHLELDLQSHALSKEAFAKVFQWSYNNFAEDSQDVNAAENARVKLDRYRQWKHAMRNVFTDINADYSNHPVVVRAQQWLHENHVPVAYPENDERPLSHKSFMIVFTAVTAANGLGTP